MNRRNCSGVARGGSSRPAQPAIDVAHPPGRAGIGEALDGDPHRHAGGALRGRPGGRQSGGCGGTRRATARHKNRRRRGRPARRSACARRGRGRRGRGQRSVAKNCGREPSRPRSAASDRVAWRPSTGRCAVVLLPPELMSMPIPSLTDPWPAAPAFRRHLIAACQRAASQTTTPVLARRRGPLRGGFGPARRTVLSPGAARFLWRVYLNKEFLSKSTVKIAHWAGVYRRDSRIVNRRTPSLAGANPWRARNVLSAVDHVFR